MTSRDIERPVGWEEFIHHYES